MIISIYYHNHSANASLDNRTSLIIILYLLQLLQRFQLEDLDNDLNLVIT